MKVVVDLLFRTRRLALRLLRLKTRGVKVLLVDRGGAILLIRNSYGRSDLWVLPGGGVGRGETPEKAARREVREEIGLEVPRLAFVSAHFSRSEGRRDMIHLFSGQVVGEPRPDRFEVEEAGFFPPDRLPDNVSPATRRRIAEHLGRRSPDGKW